MKKHRFEVVEYYSFYAVRDRETGKEAHMSDGVDVIFTKSGKALKAGTVRLKVEWQRSLNEYPAETLEAYFGGAR